MTSGNFINDKGSRVEPNFSKFADDTKLVQLMQQKEGMPSKGT